MDPVRSRDRNKKNKMMKLYMIKFNRLTKQICEKIAIYF